MILKELAKYDPIIIQCHDNPDADAIAAGYALCRYFESRGKSVRMVYGGRNKIQKPNLMLMLKHLEIPIVYIENTDSFLQEEPEGKIRGLLITVDCQYGSGNVTYLPAEKVAVIPGSAFGPGGEGYVRATYAASMHDLGEALDRLERFLGAL